MSPTHTRLPSQLNSSAGSQRQRNRACEVIQPLDLVGTVLSGGAPAVIILWVLVEVEYCFVTLLLLPEVFLKCDLDF